MKLPIARRVLLTLTVILGWLTLAPMARAADPGVTDDAKFFTPDTVEKVNAEIRQAKADFGKDLVVETFATIPDDRKAAWEAAKDDKAAKAHFFAQWLQDQAKAKTVRGVFVLITREPGHVEVKAGAETRLKAFTQQNQERLSQILLEAFRDKKYDEGLTKAADYFRDTLKANGVTKEQSAAAAANDTFHHVTGGTNSGSGTGTGGGGTVAQTPYQAPAGTPSTPPQNTTARHGVSIMWIIIVIVGAILLIRVLSGLGSRNRSNYGGPGYGPGPGGPGGYNQGPGYGGGGYGYGGGGGGGGGGGFFRGMFGGLLGGAAGSYLYDRASHHDNQNTGGVFPGGSGGGSPADTNSSSGGDFSSGGGGGGEDFSGGGSSGGDFGSSSSDAGSSSGGSFDSGGGGGDSGGGGGGSGGDF